MTREISREEILAMPAGRELDELVIAKVMDWDKVDEGRMSEPLYTWYSTKNGVRFDVTAKAWTFNPSQSISAAWEVVEKMKSDGWSVSITTWGNDKHDRPEWKDRWKVVFGFEEGPYAFESYSIAEAASKAALLTTMEETP